MYKYKSKLLGKFTIHECSLVLIKFVDILELKCEHSCKEIKLGESLS